MRRRARRSAQPLDGMEMLVTSFTSQGFIVVPDVIDSAICSLAASRLEESPSQGAGSRRLLIHSWCQELAHRVRQHATVAALLPADSVAVQCTVFDKSPSKNWLVAFHQDRSIPVRRRMESPSLSGWSEKEGDIFVQPPREVLERVTAVRIHIDACPVESGALRVVPGSHKAGVLTPKEAEHLRSSNGEEAVPSPRGGALILKPLLLHASSKARVALQRRVLHFVFGPRALPLGLEWQHAI
jgi:ectoine hydroxylase-related dioxygenase (phytanoyl-CoA dioxygenase family)